MSKNGGYTTSLIFLGIFFTFAWTVYGTKIYVRCSVFPLSVFPLSSLVLCNLVPSGSLQMSHAKRDGGCVRCRFIVS